jgi:hypothetical protein
MGILQMCLEKECQIWTIKENYRLRNDIQNKVMAFAFGLSAEIDKPLLKKQRLRLTYSKIYRDDKKTVFFFILLAYKKLTDLIVMQTV